MLRNKEEILAELDSTLDQLLKNIETVNKAEITELSEIEVQALHKTQESLLARFIHMKDHLKENMQGAKQTEQLQDKLVKFSKLNASFLKSIKEELTYGPLQRKKPRIGKNRRRLKIS